jgi:putative hemolysin
LQIATPLRHDGLMKRLLPLLFIATGLAACGSDAEPSDTTSEVGLANPASVFCVEQGGTVEIVDEADGQVGYCNLPDGSRIEEWEYFRSQDPSANTEP